jgi:hypothetical protein
VAVKTTLASAAHVRNKCPGRLRLPLKALREGSPLQRSTAGRATVMATVDSSADSGVALDTVDLPWLPPQAPYRGHTPALRLGFGEEEAVLKVGQEHRGSGFADALRHEHRLELRVDNEHRPRTCAAYEALHALELRGILRIVLCRTARRGTVARRDEYEQSVIWQRQSCLVLQQARTAVRGGWRILPRARSRAAIKEEVDVCWRPSIVATENVDQPCAKGKRWQRARALNSITMQSNLQS